MASRPGSAEFLDMERDYPIGPPLNASPRETLTAPARGARGAAAGAACAQPELCSVRGRIRPAPGSLAAT